LIHKEKLANGLTVVVEPIDTVKSVTVGIWIKTGSRDETKTNNGISHFIEHMLFKGTSKYSPKAIAEAFDSIGGEINAFTSREYTCLYAKVLDQHIHFALDIMIDMIVASSFDTVEIEREKKVVLEEINMTEDTPDDIIHDYLMELVYKDNPLAYPILGTKQTVKNLTRESILDYYRKHYSATNMVVSIAGSIEIEQLYSIHEKLEVIPFRECSSSVRKEPNYSINKLVKHKEIEQAHISIALPGVGIKDERQYPFMLMNNLIGGSMSSMLFQKIREEKGLAYTIFSYNNAFIDTGLWTIYAATSPKEIDHVIQSIYTILKDVSKKGFQEAQLHVSKEQLKGFYLLGLESTNSRMSRNARNEMILHDHPTLEDTIAKIDQITLQELNGVTKQISIDDIATAIITSPN
jgi:predicted Zn-dependent peptidase